MLVGAGCSSGGDVNLNASINTNAATAPVEQRDDTGGMQLDDGTRANVNAGAAVDANAEDEMTIEAPATVDASINALLQDGDEEIKAESDSAIELETADGDKAEVNAFGSASYDETK